MSAATANPSLDTTLSQKAQRFAVWLGEDGEPPTEAEESPPYRFVSCKRSAGGRRLDTAQFEIVAEAALQDIRTPTEFRRAVEVRAPSKDTETDEAGIPDTLVFSGELGICSVSLSATEKLSAMARVEQWHFGTPVVGWLAQVLDGAETLDRIIEEDIRFNPEIDGQILPNRSSWSNEIDDGSTTEYPPGETPVWYVWVDPESVRSTEAQTVLTQTANTWTLAQAALSLCYLLNGYETYIKNPEFGAINDALATAPALRDWTIRRGMYLPAALDELLEPHGCSWFVRQTIQTIDDVETVERRIVVFKRGEGPEKTVTLQAKDEDRDITKSNLAKHDTEYNIADVANKIEVYGSFLEVEGTWELVRCWAEADDALSLEDLAKGAEGSQYQTKPDVWRKWALNEADDYTGTRTSITEGFDVNAIDDGSGGHPLGTDNIKRRRRFYPPLTKDNDGGRRDYLVEYYIPGVSYGDPGTWQDISTTPNSSFLVLERECGIIFTGHTPPDELHARGNNDGTGARVRITACIRGDQRISHTAVRTALSPNGNDVTLVVNVPDRFHKRTRLADGDNMSRFAELLGAESDADDVDNTTSLQAYAEKLRDQEQAARVVPSIVLEGFRPEYEISDLITRIEGRNIDLNQNSWDQAVGKYPQITGIEYTQDATILTLDVFDEVA